VKHVLEGIASWYGPYFHGRPTASGELFDQNALTAAHATLALGTRVRVTNLRNRRSVVVRINDRPGNPDRIIDLSRAAGQAIGLIYPGIGRVRLEVLGDWSDQGEKTPARGSHPASAQRHQ